MTSGEAAALQAGALSGGGCIAWFITLSDTENPGRAVAWMIKADFAGRQRLPGKLVADTIEEVRAMLPTGLVRWDRTPSMPEGTVEAWRLMPCNPVQLSRKPGEIDS
jgi:hypothetical protein